jgi:hypothetical protein
LTTINDRNRVATLGLALVCVNGVFALEIYDARKLNKVFTRPESKRNDKKGLHKCDGGRTRRRWDEDDCEHGSSANDHANGSFPSPIAEHRNNAAVHEVHSVDDLFDMPGNYDDQCDGIFTEETPQSILQVKDRGQNVCVHVHAYVYVFQ